MCKEMCELANNKTILVVDDDMLIRSYLKELLEENGYNVLLASEGKMGLKKLGEHEVDLLVTDLVMPDCDGFELLRKLRTQIPIIAMSGHAPAPGTYLKMAKALGAVTIAKPFLSSPILEAIHGLIGEACLA